MTQWIAVILDAIKGIVEAVKFARQKRKEKQLADELEKRDDKTTTDTLRDLLD